LTGDHIEAEIESQVPVNVYLTGSFGQAMYGNPYFTYIEDFSAFNVQEHRRSVTARETDKLFVIIESAQQSTRQGTNPQQAQLRLVWISDNPPEVYEQIERGDNSAET